MPNKKTKALVPVGEPDFSNILTSDMPISVKRSKLLIELGLRKPKKKYASAEERKAAAKDRAAKRKANRLEVLKKYGLEPKPKVKKTKAQKREKRRERGKVKRELFKEFVIMHPEMAKKHGFDPSRFRP